MSEITAKQAKAIIKSNWPPESYTMLREALSVAISALEKQVVKEITIHKSKGYSGRNYYHYLCPSCGCNVAEQRKFCPECGRALKWPEVRN